MYGFRFPIDLMKKHQYKSNLVLNINNSDGKKFQESLGKTKRTYLD